MDYDFRERYNEIMFDERDIIEKFLKDQYDIRYGRQRDTWHFEPAIEVIAHNGSLVQIHDIKLDTDKFVVFNVEAFCEKNVEWECCDFAYGELSKVIEALPDASEINKKNAINDLKIMTRNYNISAILRECPFEFNGHQIKDFEDMGEEGIKLVLSTKTFTLDTTSVVPLRDHLNIEILHCSNEYKELMELLSLEENMRFECQNYGDATFVIDGTDMTFDVSSLSRDDKGNLVIYGSDIDDEICDVISLTEKEIKPEYLTSVIECMKPKYGDIMDTYNGHNDSLVEKINLAWKSAEYHDRFSEILIALSCRDHEEFEDKYGVSVESDGEWAMAHAHEIMEGVCDDWDLETILSFIRYK